MTNKQIVGHVGVVGPDTPFTKSVRKYIKNTMHGNLWWRPYGTEFLILPLSNSSHTYGILGVIAEDNEGMVVFSPHEFSGIRGSIEFCKSLVLGSHPKALIIY